MKIKQKKQKTKQTKGHNSENKSKGHTLEARKRRTTISACYTLSLCNTYSYKIACSECVMEITRM